MKREKENLLQDVLVNAEQDRRRAAILAGGARILRHKRYARLAVRCCMMGVIAGLVVLAGQRLAGRKNDNRIIASNAAVTNSHDFEIHYLSDDELLNLFPDTPVGLATFGGKKRLIFPRPGDEARFISRLPN